MSQGVTRTLGVLRRMARSGVASAFGARVPIARLPPSYSHSMVAGGFELMS